MGIRQSQFSLFLFTFCLATLSTVTNAQQINKGGTLKECINYALENNAKIRQSEADHHEYYYQIQEVKSNLLPQVSGSGVIDRNIVIPTMILPGEIVGQPGTKIPAQMGTKNLLDFSAQIEQVIFDPALFQGIRIAKTNQELLTLQKELTEEEVIYNVSTIFYEIARTKEELKNVEHMLILQTESYTIVDERIEQGISRPVDRNRIQVNINGLKTRKRGLESIIYQQTNYLKALIGVNVNEDFTIQYGIVLTPQINDAFLPYENTNRTEIQLLTTQKNLVNFEIIQEKKKYLPTLSGLFSAGYQFQSDQFRITQDPWFSSVAIGLRLKVPIFDGHTKRSRIQQLHWQNQRIESQILQKQHDLEADERNAFYKLQRSRENLTEQKQNVNLAEDNYNKTNLLYKQGLIDIGEVFSTESSLLDAKTAYSNECIAYKIAEIELQKALGTLKNNL
ncbi:TolC family protein [Sphingobacterium spiritivorum]|uniref:TolC family protein n=1 Tax=Sphingobacterium spiritivorum TaxID=258 RepID=UPI003DA667A4